MIIDIWTQDTNIDTATRVMYAHDAFDSRNVGRVVCGDQTQAYLLASVKMLKRIFVTVTLASPACDWLTRFEV